MVYLKSLLAGLIAVVIAAVLASFGVVGFIAVKSHNLPPDQSWGWDPISFFRNSLIAWAFLLLGFLVGFVWEYRRSVVQHR